MLLATYQMDQFMVLHYPKIGPLVAQHVRIENESLLKELLEFVSKVFQKQSVSVPQYSQPCSSSISPSFLREPNAPMSVEFVARLVEGLSDMLRPDSQTTIKTIVAMIKALREFRPDFPLYFCGHNPRTGEAPQVGKEDAKLLSALEVSPCFHDFLLYLASSCSFHGVLFLVNCSSATRHGCDRH